jgi:hypothetical protein
MFGDSVNNAKDILVKRGDEFRLMERVQPALE